MVFRVLLALALSGLAGCSVSSVPEDPPPSNPPPTPPPASNPDLPSLDDLPSWLRERPIPSMHGGLPLYFDATQANGITAAADCAAMITSCLERTHGDFDACVASPPTCATQQPWTEAACCPQTCKTDFSTRRATGRSGFDAYIDVFVKDMSCFPSLEAL